MHAELVAAASSLELAIDELKRASAYSDVQITTARSHLQGRVQPEQNLDVLLFGSLARREASDKSDFDYLVVAHGRPSGVRKTRELLTAVDEVRAQMEFKAPGGSGLFGGIISAPDLTERIGLEQDTNTTHTRRILLLLESESIYQPELHDELVKAILERYLADYEPPKIGVPRFLLNDILRYWRTMAVDYQAKRWENTKVGWGLRYLKLRISRKLMIAGAITSLFLRAHARKDMTVEYLVGQFRMPSLARLAQLHTLSDAVAVSLKQVLSIADDFLRELGDETFRADASRIGSRSDFEGRERMKIWQRKGDQLQVALEGIFFSDELAPLSKKYLTF